MKKIIMIASASLFITFGITTISMAASSHDMTKHEMSTEDMTKHEMAAKDMTKHKMAIEDMTKHKMPAMDMKSHDMGSDAMKKVADHGVEVHSSTVGDYHLTYNLIDMREKMKGMKNMPAMKATHHLMLFIKSHDDHEAIAEGGTVGYLVKNPDGTTQKMMTMAMGGGFGADLDFGAKGVYTIKIKALAEGNKLMDTFKYEVK